METDEVHLGQGERYAEVSLVELERLSCQLYKVPNGLLVADWTIASHLDPTLSLHGHLYILEFADD